jgi:uncharacterized membrane-anchored protein YhcB (DUF1043 family)
MPDLTCLIGLMVGIVIGMIVGIPLGMRFYWKTGHW